MTLSASGLMLLVGISLVVTIAAPIILLLLFIKDSKAGRLW